MKIIVENEVWIVGKMKKRIEFFNKNVIYFYNFWVSINGLWDDFCFKSKFIDKL